MNPSVWILTHSVKQIGYALQEGAGISLSTRAESLHCVKGNAMAYRGNGAVLSQVHTRAAQHPARKEDLNEGIRTPRSPSLCTA